MVFFMYCLPVLSSSCRNEMQDNYERPGKKNTLYNFHLCSHTCKSLIKSDRVRTSNEYDTDDKFLDKSRLLKVCYLVCVRACVRVCLFYIDCFHD